MKGAAVTGVGLILWQAMQPVAGPHLRSPGRRRRNRESAARLSSTAASPRSTARTREGRLRWGGEQEAFWGDYFNGAKRENPWAHWVPAGRLPTKPDPVEIFGLQIAQRERPINLDRLFMARFGDIARIEASGREVRVTLRSGTAFDLDRFSASDFDDGLAVWDTTRGVAEIDSLRIRSIDLLAAPPRGANPDRLYGKAHTRHGDFTGFIEWNRKQSLGTDELHGLRFNTIRSIARRSEDSSAVRLLDGREVVLSGTSDVGKENRGLYVDDARYGRVLVSWNAFESVELTRGGSGPAYSDFPPGRAITGSVTTRTGRRLAGRLVYDLDESEVTETLDAPAEGVDYTIPFSLIASIVVPDAGRARVKLNSGEELKLDRSGDLGADNAGMLIFVNGRQSPEYVRWTDVAQVDLDRSLPQFLRDSVRDLRAVKAAVLDEDLVRVHARHDHAGEINALALALERLRIRARLAAFRIQRDAVWR